MSDRLKVWTGLGLFLLALVVSVCDTREPTHTPFRKDWAERYMLNHMSWE